MDLPPLATGSLRPALARRYDVGWEVPPGWRIEERAEGMGATDFVVIDPDGTEAPVDVMGQGVGNG